MAGFHTLRWTPRAALSPWDIPWEPRARDRSPPCCPSWSDRARSDLDDLARCWADVGNGFLTYGWSLAIMNQTWQQTIQNEIDDFPIIFPLGKQIGEFSSCLCRYLHVSPIIVIPCHTKVGWVVPARFNFSLGTVDRFCWDSRANPLVVATEPAEVGFQVEFRNWKTCLKKYAWVYSGYLRVYFEPYKPPCGEAKMIFFCDRPVTHPCEGWAWPPCAWEVAWAPPQWLSWSEWLIGFSRIGL